MRFLYFGSLLFLSMSGSQKLKIRVGVFLRFRSKVTKHFQNCEKTMGSDKKHGNGFKMEMAIKSIRGKNC